MTVTIPHGWNGSSGIGEHLLQLNWQNEYALPPPAELEGRAEKICNDEVGKPDRDGGVEGGFSSAISHSTRRWAEESRRSYSCRDSDSTSSDSGDNWGEGYNLEL